MTPLVLPGDTLPGTGGATVVSLLGGPDASFNGNAAFTASLTGGTTGEGVFIDLAIFPRILPVATQGEAADGTGGGTYGNFSILPAPNNGGSVAFTASINGGSSSSGIFLPEPGLGLSLAIGFAGLGVLSRRHSRFPSKSV